MIINLLAFKSIRNELSKPKMKQLKLMVTTLLLCFYSLAILAQDDLSNNSPNIIYILADDLGIGDLSVYNENSKIQTPNLDKMGAEGMKFTDAHTLSSVCTPTYYGILTGRYNWRAPLFKKKEK